MVDSCSHGEQRGAVSMLPGRTVKKRAVRNLKEVVFSTRILV